ncbi:MAG: IS701 family transposase [Planctomycetota bacterium]|jgi:SRSO17 transposase
MNAVQIREVGKGIKAYLRGFSDCFGRCDSRAYLRVYVQGQTSDLQRKSAEPMALRAQVPPRSLQAFLGLLSWDEQRMVERVQQIVARDHGHPYAIGIVDETGSPKKGRHTAGVQRQWCGRTGKVDNCVVSVHLGYTAGRFHCLLDSDLFLPKSWADDPARRQEVGIPEEVEYRSKPQIALDQIRRALGNGLRVAAWTFDEHYGQSYAFLDGLDALGQTYVAEVPCTFRGWAAPPRVLYRATPQEMRRKGQKRRFPRLAKTAAKTSQVRNLLVHSPAFTDQPWTPIHLKDGEKGPLVREVKVVAFWMKRNGLPTRPHWLIVARNPEAPDEQKYFVSNAPAGCPLEWLVYVGYARWPIEECFKEEKDELGFDHFEVRGWRSIHRHMALTQVSHLYLNRMREHLVAQEKAQEQAGVFSLPGTGGRPSALPGREPNAQPDSRCFGGLVPRLAVGAACP